MLNRNFNSVFEKLIVDNYELIMTPLAGENIKDINKPCLVRFTIETAYTMEESLTKAILLNVRLISFTKGKTKIRVKVSGAAVDIPFNKNVEDYIDNMKEILQKHIGNFDILEHHRNHSLSSKDRDFEGTFICYNNFEGIDHDAVDISVDIPADRIAINVHYKGLGDPSIKVIQVPKNIFTEPENLKNLPECLIFAWMKNLDEHILLWETFIEIADAIKEFEEKYI